MIGTVATAIRDPSRLAALRRLALLDTPAEPAFDRIACLAARICRAPIALVTLVDEDRQFFKSCIGLPEPWMTLRQTPLSHSFCRHVVAARELLAINDARSHPLVCDSPAVSELGLVAYLGAPLESSEGHTLGALCVVDSAPREWSAEDARSLQELAASVAAVIELRAVTADLERLKKARTEFVAVVSHAFGTPITVIQGFSELIRDEPLSSGEIREYAAEIYKEAARLAQMITQIREKERMETGKEPPHPVTIEMSGATRTR